jgi:hypothetical protein
MSIWPDLVPCPPASTARVAREAASRCSQTSSLKIATINDDQGRRIGQVVDLWSIVFGQLRSIDERERIEEPGEPDDLDAESRELASLDIATRSGTADLEERCSSFKGQELDQFGRVQITTGPTTTS